MTVVREPVTIRPIARDDTASLATYVAIRNAVMPENTDSLEQLRWEDATYPGQVVRLLALGASGTAVGTASAGRIWMHEETFERAWLGIWVLPGHRGRGAGSALHRAASEAARSAGKTGFQTELSEAQAEGHRFLAHRGFVVTERNKMVRLDLAGLEPPAPRPPAGIAIVSLAARPDLLAGVHAVAVEAFPDIPSGDEPIDAGSLEAFVARDVERAGVPKDGFMVALDEATGEVAATPASSSRRAARPSRTTT